MRAIWSGYISFGLVNIPVKLYSAVEEETINFDLLHQDDLSPIRYARFCKSENREVSYNEIVRGYEYEKDHYVVMDEEDFINANVRQTKTITILDFAKAEEIDFLLFEKPYYLHPEKGGEKPYELLRKALFQAKKVGIGKYVLRNRERLIMLKADDDILILDQLRFFTQIRKQEKIPETGRMNISEEEIKMALSLINELSRPFKPEDYRDTYNDELMRVINEKIAGKVPSRKGEAPTPTPVPDLMAMLKQSLESERQEKEKLGTK